MSAPPPAQHDVTGLGANAERAEIAEGYGAHRDREQPGHARGEKATERETSERDPGRELADPAGREPPFGGAIHHRHRAAEEMNATIESTLNKMTPPTMTHTAFWIPSRLPNTRP